MIMTLSNIIKLNIEWIFLQLSCKFHDFKLRVFLFVCTKLMAADVLDNVTRSMMSAEVSLPGISIVDNAVPQGWTATSGYMCYLSISFIP